MSKDQSRKKRISRQQKVQLVLSLLRGEALEELARMHQVSAHELTKWRDIFLKKGESGFIISTPVQSREAELERIIGRQQMEIELLKKKMKPYGQVPVSS